MEFRNAAEGAGGDDKATFLDVVALARFKFSALSSLRGAAGFCGDLGPVSIGASVPSAAVSSDPAVICTFKVSCASSTEPLFCVGIDIVPFEVPTG